MLQNENAPDSETESWAFVEQPSPEDRYTTTVTSCQILVNGTDVPL